MYNVAQILDDLNGHEGAPDREIKIKLADGTVKNIEGFLFHNCCIGGDDVIYIKELNPLKKEWGESIKNFIRFANKIMKDCEIEYERISDDDNADPDDIIHIENEIAKLADFYIKRCKLEKDVKERYGHFSPGAGDTDEVYIKIAVLKDFIDL